MGHSITNLLLQILFGVVCVGLGRFCQQRGKDVAAVVAYVIGGVIALSNGFELYVTLSHR
jgi:hypothetical protein